MRAPRLKPDDKSPEPRATEPAPAFVALAIFSIVLPFIGIALGFWGAYLLLAGDQIVGWLLIAAGAGCIALDIWIDFVWAAEAMRFTDEPNLNKAGSEFVGRVAVVIEPLRNGRGKVRIGDTVWMAEGPDMTTGTIARIVAVHDVVLVVERD